MKRIWLLLFMFSVFGQSAYTQDSPKKHSIEIKKMQFVPAKINVKKGDTVVWVNKDFFPHDVAESKNKSWQSSPLKQGESWSKVITKSEDYYCTLHVIMKGEIVLKD